MKHYYQRIPGWFDFQDIYKEMVEKVSDNAHFVEVGSFVGKSTSFLGVEIINSGKAIKLDAVDVFQRTKTPYTTDNMLEKFKCYTKPIEHVVNIIALSSVEASELYSGASLDFVFIDANHDYEYISQDIKSWLPKIKKGGYIGGHDYDFPGVKKAVDEVFGEDERLQKRRRSWLVAI